MRIRCWLADGSSQEAAAALLVEYALKMDSGDIVAAVVLCFSFRPPSQSSFTRKSAISRLRPRITNTPPQADRCTSSTLPTQASPSQSSATTAATFC
eukprot:gene16014-22151_t